MDEEELAKLFGDGSFHIDEDLSSPHVANVLGGKFVAVLDSNYCKRLPLTPTRFSSFKNLHMGIFKPKPSDSQRYSLINPFAEENELQFFYKDLRGIYVLGKPEILKKLTNFINFPPFS